MTIFVYLCFFLGFVDLIVLPFKIYSVFKNFKSGGVLLGKRNNRNFGIFGRRNDRDFDRRSGSYGSDGILAGRNGDFRADRNDSDRDSDNFYRNGNDDGMSDISDNYNISTADSKC